MQLFPRTATDASAQLPPCPRTARHACASAFNTHHSSPSSPPGSIRNASPHRSGERSTSYTLSGSALLSVSGETGPGGSQATVTTRGAGLGLGAGATGGGEATDRPEPTGPPSSALVRGAGGGEEAAAAVDRTAEEPASGTPPRSRGAFPSCTATVTTATAPTNSTAESRVPSEIPMTSPQSSPPIMRESPRAGQDDVPGPLVK
ncbi:hypothetical protein ABZX85_24080 [Streptomyces sp. NPDC004539]|uniref:hypothetical protein n=1 Tax=Streptomyces sp. NPDC004539 TaxID=3154280 RepID=UPI0033BF8DF5